MTPRQLKFIEVYSGNGTEAAKLAGYTGSDNVLGKTAHDLLRNPKVVEAIKSRGKVHQEKRILNREERQAFWTQVMEDETQQMRDRLRASELLGRSEADFIEKIQHSGNVTLEQIITGSMSSEDESNNE